MRPDGFDQGHTTVVDMQTIGKSVGGGWHVEYEEVDAIGTTSSIEVDIPCAAAMRTCSSGLLSTLALRLGCQSHSYGQVQHWGRDFNMNRTILAHVGAARMTSITRVRTDNAPLTRTRSRAAFFVHRLTLFQLAAAVPLFRFTSRRLSHTAPPPRRLQILNLAVFTQIRPSALSVARQVNGSRRRPAQRCHRQNQRQDRRGSQGCRGLLAGGCMRSLL